MLIGQWLGDRRLGRTSHRKAMTRHQAEVDTLRLEVQTLLADEIEDRHRESPDLAVLWAVARGPETGLWCRRPRDEDHLRVRIGLGVQGSRLRLAGEVPADLRSPELDDVPVTVDLAAAGVLGLSGPRPRVSALAASLLLQLATWHSPQEVRVVLVTGSTRPGQEWSWASRLPHARPLVPDSRIASVASADSDAARELLAQLGMLVRERREALSGPGVAREPSVVVVLDGAHDLRRLPGVASLLRDGPLVGIYAICLDDVGERLPAETAAQVELGGSVAPTATVRVGTRNIEGVVPDLPTRGWVEQVARFLAPLRDATPDEGEGQVPPHVGFRELYAESGMALDPLDAAALERHWSAPDRPRAILLGRSAAGPYAVNLAADGPHALVGGTTGSGKSELLQALVAGLAIAYRPEELSLVLVDYKGGSAFKDCARLPHTVGLVTDLDEHLAARALASLGAELKRRERILSEHGAKDLDDYLAKRPSAGPLLPRLVLVVDEFKMLADELPDFVDGLVRLAAVGRSLGIHLVLATQRPSGIVSGDMRANLGLRVALRVRDRADSVDLVESADAAAISDRHPGRAIVRTSGLELETVQTAQVGRPCAETTGANRSVPLAWPVVWSDLAARPPSSPRPSGSGNTRSELGAFVDAAREAARSLGVAAQTSPWLPPLPKRVPVASLRTPPGGARAVALGLVDRPREQRQDPYLWDVTGHLGLVGGAGTGRTTTLRLIALALAESRTPAEVHIHVIEGTSGPLRHLEALPHVGSVLGAEDERRTQRLVRRLVDEVARRRSRPADDLPRIVLLVDNWEAVEDAFEGLDHGASTEELLRLLRDGLSAGLTVVVTGGRALTSGRISPLLQRRLVLDLPDPLDLALAGVAVGARPAQQGPARAVDPRDGCEVQLAFAGGSPEPDDQDHAVAMAATIQAMEYAALPPATLPWRIAPLPDHVRLEELPGPAASTLIVGLGGDDREPLGFDLERDERQILVVGPPRSGRSCALRVIAEQFLQLGRTLAVITTARSPLARLGGIPGVHLVEPADTDRFIGLRTDCPELGVIVDEAEGVEGTPMGAALLEATRLVASAGGLVAVGADVNGAATAYRGLVPEIGRYATGLLLGPRNPGDGEVFRLRVEPPTERRAGRGVHVANGVATPVQVALPS